MSVVKEGLLFVQKRGGADHFAECRVVLMDSDELEVEAVQEEKQRFFNRGFDVAKMTRIELVEKKDKGLCIIKMLQLENVIVHMVSESVEECRSWYEALQTVVDREALSEKVYKCLEDYGICNELLCLLEGMKGLIGSKVCSRPRNGKLLLHRICERMVEQSLVSTLDVSIMKLVLQCYPQACMVRSSDTNALPIHVILKGLSRGHRGPIDRLVSLLVRADWECVLEPFTDVETGESGVPIHMACGSLSLHIVQALLGADDPGLRMNDFLGEDTQLLTFNSLGQTALMCTLAHLENEPLGKRGKVALIEQICVYLVKMECRAIQLADAKGNTPIHVAARVANKYLLRVFLENVESREKRDKICASKNLAGKSPLEILLETQRELQLSGNSDKLYDVEHCLSLLRLGPESAIFHLNRDLAESKHYSSTSTTASLNRSPSDGMTSSAISVARTQKKRETLHRREPTPQDCFDESQIQQGFSLVQIV
mmetsp:Transcript_19273/g.31681  ORF Transcript_19273/g.31681 Transcript_19273/m.31681 type:complete len:484 (-) Transcript_19273:1483-2934(-)